MIQYQLKKKQSDPSTFNMALSLARIVFMGTPEFAVASLDALIKTGFNVVGVITAPDKPAGRGLKPHESAVKKYALEKGLKLLQPEKLKNPEFVAELTALNADVQVVVAFRMLPDIIWSMPPKGTINLHASLLPQYRGAAPINWAIINGEKQTGVTTFKLQHAIDTGNILMSEVIAIDEHETAGELLDRMKEIGADILAQTVAGVLDGSLQETSQSSLLSGHDNVPLHHAPKITTETCRLDWSRPVDELYNLVRGLSPYPTAFADLAGKTLKIFRAEKELSSRPGIAGTWETDGKSFLKFACANGYLQLKEIQLEGKKKMNIGDFLRGYRFNAGT